MNNKVLSKWVSKSFLRRKIKKTHDLPKSRGSSRRLGERYGEIEYIWVVEL